LIQTYNVRVPAQRHDGDIAMQFNAELGLSRLDPNKKAEEAKTACVVARPPLAEPLSAEQIESLRETIVERLHTVYDPELPVNIYELGLIYDLAVKPDGTVDVKMTLTTPACPVAGTLPGEVQRKIMTVEPIVAAKVDLVWEPAWTKDRMTEAAKLQLGIDD
jgi:FeS assembly SUF system protein